MAALVDAVVEERSDELLGHYYQVEAVWSGVDRARVGGYAIARRSVAERLARAMRAGAVYFDAEVRRDVNGQTYVQAKTRVLGRRANADLRKLGF